MTAADLTSGCTFKLLSCRDAKIYSITTAASALGVGDTITMDGAKVGMKLGTIQGVIAQKSNAACASATYSSTTITLGDNGTEAAKAFTLLVWGY